MTTFAEGPLQGPQLQPRPSTDGNSMRECVSNPCFMPNTLFKRNPERKSTMPKVRKTTDKSLPQPWCSHSNTIHDPQLQKTMVFRKQPRQQETLMEPLQPDPQRLSCKAAKNYAQWRRKLQVQTVQTRISAPQPPPKIETLCKWIFKTKITSAKIEKSYSQITIATLMQPLQYDSRPPAAKDNEWYYTNSCGSEKPWWNHYSPICRDWVAKQHRTMRNGAGNCRSKPESWCHSPKKTILKHFVKGILNRKSSAPRLRKPGGKSLSEPGCSHSNTIYDAELQNTIV